MAINEAIKLAEKLRKQVEVVTCYGDLINIDQRNSLIRTIREKKPDLIINNAGFGLYGKAIDLDYHEQLAMIDLNVGAVVEISLEAGKMLVKNKKKGVILNVSSAAAFFPFPYFAIYGATKAFINNFSEALDQELKSSGIRVLVSCPGPVDTRFRETASKGRSKAAIKQFGVMKSDFVAQEIWWQIQKGKAVHIIDWKYRLGLFLLNFLPKSLAFRILSSSVKSR